MFQIILSSPSPPRKIHIAALFPEDYFIKQSIGKIHWKTWVRDFFSYFEFTKVPFTKCLVHYSLGRIFDTFDFLSNLIASGLEFFKTTFHFCSVFPFLNTFSFLIGCEIDNFIKNEQKKNFNL